MRTPRSRTASTITLLFLAGGALVVVLAVVAVVRDVRDDAAWAAVVLGLAIATWGIWFHGLVGDAATTADASDAVADRAVRADAADPQAPSGAAGTRPRSAGPLGTAAIAGIIGAGGYWLLRGPLDRGVPEAVVVAVITFALWLLNRGVDAVVRRRQAGGAVDGR